LLPGHAGTAAKKRCEKDGDNRSFKVPHAQTSFRWGRRAQPEFDMHNLSSTCTT
jgi:hypothetical protein